MAGYNIFENSQEVLEDGHLSIFYHPLPIFNGGISYNFSECAGFLCDIGLTIWELIVQINQPTIDSNVHVGVYIMRDDYIRVRVNVFFQMEVYTQGENVPIIQPQSFEMQDFGPAETKTEYFSDYIPIGVLSLQADNELVLKISFSVRGCHLDRGRNRKASNGDIVDRANKALRPNM